MALGLVRAGACLLLGLLVCPACTQACLMCFVTDKERIRICQMFVGMKAWKTKVCDEKFQLAFEDLLKTEINYDERNNLHDSFTQMVHSLQETAVAKGFYIKAFSKAAEEMKKAILQLKKGVQELTRRFICDGCYSLICKLPLNCPVKDVTVNRGDQAMFSCVVDFQLPKEDISYSWKFAKGPDSGHVLLPRPAAGPRVRGADPPGEARPRGHLLLRDPTRRAPRGAALLLPERHWPAPARGDRAPSHLPGSGALVAEGTGSGGALEARPGRATDQSLGPDMGGPVLAGRPGGRHGRQPDGAGVVSGRANPGPQPPPSGPGVQIQTPASSLRPWGPGPVHP
ncbi:sperm acrosome membrane-associated protein 6 isoform X2 [Dipodomys merriami]|uniref:sperm acrosome membrane-associated protein 6 isoform X2 n=1 Tax=Dipodomys merriami TaxID=94247 RepID=UPI003856008B